MAAKTKIEWAANADGSPGRTWNPIMGCSPCSPGCDNCYALAMIERFKGRKGWPDSAAPSYFEERMKEPARWRKPSTVFMCSMSDLFHERTPEWLIDKVFRVMTGNPQHKFLVLTKRPKKMLSVKG